MKSTAIIALFSFITFEIHAQLPGELTNEALLQAVQESRAKFTSLLQKSEREKQEYRQIAEQLASRLKQTQAALLQQQESGRRVAAQTKQVIEENARLKSELQTQQRQLEEKQKVEAQFQQVQSDLENRLKEQQASSSAKEISFKEQLQTLTQKSAGQVEALAQENSSLQRQITSQEQQSQATQAALLSAQQRQQALENEVNRLTTAHTHLEAAKNEALQVNESLTGQLRSAQQRAQHLEGQVEQVNARSDQLEQDLLAARSTENAQKQTIEKLSTRLSSSEDAIRNGEENNRNLQQRLAALQSTLETLEAELKQQKTINTQLEESIEAEKRRVTQANHSLSTSEEEKDRLQAEVSTLRQTQAKKDDQIHALQNQAAQLTKEAGQSRADFVALQTESAQVLAALQQSHEQDMAALRAAHAQEKDTLAESHSQALQTIQTTTQYLEQERETVGQLNSLLNQNKQMLIHFKAGFARALTSISEESQGAFFKALQNAVAAALTSLPDSTPLEGDVLESKVNEVIGQLLPIPHSVQDEAELLILKQVQEAQARAIAQTKALLEESLPSFGAASSSTTSDEEASVKKGGRTSSEAASSLNKHDSMLRKAAIIRPSQDDQAPLPGTLAAAIAQTRALLEESLSSFESVGNSITGGASLEEIEGLPRLSPGTSSGNTLELPANLDLSRNYSPQHHDLEGRSSTPITAQAIGLTAQVLTELATGFSTPAVKSRTHSWATENGEEKDPSALASPFSRYLDDSDHRSRSPRERPSSFSPLLTGIKEEDKENATL